MKKKILFISIGNGADMRINKEIKSLSNIADVFYLGMGNYGEDNYAKKNCKEFHLIQGKKKSITTTFKQIYKFIELSIKNKFDSIHIVNEQRMIFFYPFLFHKYIVLDIFDSIFLKINKPYNKLKLLKKIIYAPVNCIFVTDENRKELMPTFVQHKVKVLENYPYHYLGSTNKNTTRLTIFYNGSMSNARGTEILKQLASKFKDIKIIMAGWIADESTMKLSKEIYVDFRGVITQKEAAVIAATESDYIMCCYEPSNTNNINASPNKIYDAIQTQTPIIMNSEVKISSFIEKKKLGYILNSFYEYDVNEIYKNLLFFKNKIRFNKEDINKYCWENIDKKLLVGHNLKEDV